MHQGLGRQGRGVSLFFLDQVPSELPISPLVLPKSSTVLGDPRSNASMVLVQPPLSVASGGTWDSSNQKPADIAKQVSALRRGEVTYLYCITGNSASQAALLEMVGLLAGHVEVVGYEQLASLARQREQGQMPQQRAPPPTGAPDSGGGGSASMRVPGHLKSDDGAMLVL